MTMNIKANYQLRIFQQCTDIKTGFVIHNAHKKRSEMTTESHSPYRDRSST